MDYPRITIEGTLYDIKNLEYDDNISLKGKVSPVTRGREDDLQGLIEESRVIRYGLALWFANKPVNGVVNFHLATLNGLNGFKDLQPIMELLDKNPQ